MLSLEWLLDRCRNRHAYYPKENSIKAMSLLLHSKHDLLFTHLVVIPGKLLENKINQNISQEDLFIIFIFIYTHVTCIIIDK